MSERIFLLILSIPLALILPLLLYFAFKKEPEDSYIHVFRKEPEDLTYILNNKENEDRD